MLSLKSSLIKLFGVLCFVIALQSCEKDKPGTYANDKISSGKRQDFHKLNDQLFAAFKDNKTDQVENMMSRDLLDNPAYKRTVELISNQSKSGNYTTLDEYYINNVTDQKPQSSYDIKITSSGTDPYTISYRSPSQETYIALLIPKGPADQWLVSAFFDKYDYGWKLSKLEFAPYSFSGKTAPGLLKLAKQQHAKGYLVDAVNTMELATKCARPNDEWQYNNEAEIYQVYGNAMNEANAHYHFPLTIQQVPTKPQIFRVLTQTMPEGVFPMIYYISKINVNDTTAVKKENESIKKVIGQILPGIDKDKEYLLFSAFNERPTGGKSVPSFDMVAKLQ
jgi:hypothetical protein